MADLTSIPSQIPFEMVSGDSKTLRVKCIGIDRQPFSLAEAVNVTWGLAKSVSSPTLVTKNLTSGVSIVQDGDDWLIDVEILPSDTEDYKGSYYHECQVIFSNGAVATPFSGDVTIVQDLVQ